MGLSRMNLKTARAWAINGDSRTAVGLPATGALRRKHRVSFLAVRTLPMEPVKRVGRMVREYFWGIMNAIIARVSNAMAEAKNARIQRIKNMACGFRNRERFRMAILFHLGGLNLMPKTLSNFTT